MHNIHFIVVDGAESHEQAQLQAEQEIMDWGTEDNWRSVIGSMRQSDQQFDRDLTYDHPLQPALTPEYILTRLGETINHTMTLPKVSTIIQTIKHGTDDNAINRTMMNYFKHKMNTFDHTGEPIDIWTDEVYSWEFDEVGLTNMCYGDKLPTETYIVAIDMHS